MNEVFTEYGNIYKRILNRIYPAKHSTGFAERNLSVNFSKAYEIVAMQNGQTAFSWFEFQFGNNNNLHIDAVVINDTTNEMFVVEAKRYNNPIPKMREVGEDIDRIGDFITELQAENQAGSMRIDIGGMKKCYGIILADVWTESDLKKEICKSYLAGVENNASEDAFLYKFGNEVIFLSQLSDVYYDVQMMNEIVDATKYNLVSFWWKIGGKEDVLY